MQLSRFTTGIKGSVYSKLLSRLQDFEGEVYPFHVGDTWMDPPEGCWMEDIRASEHPGMHKYAPPQGISSLLTALAERIERRTGVSTSASQIGVTAGATGALTAVVGAILEPNDEVMILAPTWPLVVGMVKAFHGKPVLVPFIGTVTDEEAVRETLEAYRTGATRALYLNTPHNPRASHSAFLVAGNRRMGTRT